MFLAESKRQPIRTIAQMNALAFEPVFRVIPELDATRRGFTTRVHESFETLLLNFLHSQNRPYTIGVVGITPGAGATHTCASLATAAIRHGYSVSIIDRDPKQALKRLADRGQKVVTAAGNRLTLRASTVETPEETPSDLARVPELIIHDFAPAVQSADYALEAGKLDEVVVLVRAGSTKSVDFMQVQQALKDAGCRHITLVFTRSKDFTVVTETMERPVVSDFA
jgi:Mrp family chromosome partitioning ATPase